MSLDRLEWQIVHETLIHINDETNISSSATAGATTDDDNSHYVDNIPSFKPKF
jgi:hypothetical protein